MNLLHPRLVLETLSVPFNVLRSPRLRALIDVTFEAILGVLVGTEGDDFSCSANVCDVVESAR